MEFQKQLQTQRRKNSRETILNHDSSEILKIFEYMEERPGINDIQRLGKFKKDQKEEVGNKQGSESPKRPRTILVTLNNIWDVRKLLSKTPRLRNYAQPVYISK